MDHDKTCVAGFSGSMVYPSEGTLGTKITISGSGYGTAKGKVLIGSVALKIISWSDGIIVVQLSKPLPAGVYDVTIQPKGTLPIVSESGFEVAGPEILSVNPSQGVAGDKVTIEGNFFDKKKGKVTLGGKNSKIFSWTMDASTGESDIVFQVPKGLAPGSYDLTVTNQVGSGTKEKGFTID